MTPAQTAPKTAPQTDVLLAHCFFLKNDSKQVEKMRPYAPLGTLYAASHLKQKGFTVALFDAMLADGVEAFEAMLERRRPRVVALYEDQFNFLNKMCLSHTREAAARMAAAARRAGATVIAAGSDITDHPEVYLESGVDYALVGEADHTLVELVELLTGRQDGSVEEIAGLALPGGNGAGSDDAGGEPAVRRTAPRPPERHPDRFGLPAWELLDPEPYRTAWRDAHGYYSLNLVTTRGCPFHCNWCAKPIWGQRYAMRSPASVAEEMALVKRTIAPDHLWFADDIFGLQPRWVAELADEVEARDAAIPFMIQSRIDLMTEKAVSALARAGCVEVWLGVESGSQKVLDAMDKGTKLEQVPAARERLRQAGIRACFFIQLGYPGETLEDILLTVELIRSVLPDDIGVSVSYPLPGTKFHQMVAEQLLDKDHWHDSNDLAMMFQGTYQTPFYRKLHGLLHRDLELRQALARQTGDPAVDGGAGNGRPAAAPAAAPAAEPLDPAELAAELDRLNADWFELGRMEERHRSASPTAIEKGYEQPQAPDLSRSHN